jgi:hypothetical protein
MAQQKATDFKSWGYTARKREEGHERGQEGGHEGGGQEGEHEARLNWGTCRISRLIRPAMH